MRPLRAALDARQVLQCSRTRQENTPICGRSEIPRQASWIDGMRPTCFERPARRADLCDVGADIGLPSSPWLPGLFFFIAVSNFAQTPL
jgi:hypothetical protein